MNGWIDGLMDEWMSTWIDRWMDKWMDISVIIKSKDYNNYYVRFLTYFYSLLITFDLSSYTYTLVRLGTMLGYTAVDDENLAMLQTHIQELVGYVRI